MHFVVGNFVSFFSAADLTCHLRQGFSNYGSRPHLGPRNVILGSRKKLPWQIRYKCFCKLYKKIKGRLALSLFLLHFRGNSVLHSVTCLPGCLPEPSNDNDQPNTTSYALLRHDILTY